MKRKKFHTYKCSKHQSLTCIHPQRFRLWLYTRLACSKFHSCCLLIEMTSQLAFGQLWTKCLYWTELPSFYLQRREHFWICKGKYGKWNWHAMQLLHYPWCGYPWIGYGRSWVISVLYLEILVQDPVHRICHFLGTHIVMNLPVNLENWHWNGKNNINFCLKIY